jgi:hypothetical protein
VKSKPLKEAFDVKQLEEEGEAVKEKCYRDQNFK